MVRSALLFADGQTDGTAEHGDFYRIQTPSFSLFRDTQTEELEPNTLILKLQPDEGASLAFGAKIPGPAIQLGQVHMDFHYKDYFENAPSTGYETLIYDCMIGDATLFQRADSVEAGWRIVQPYLDLCKRAAWRSAGILPCGQPKALQKPTLCWRHRGESGAAFLEGAVRTTGSDRSLKGRVYRCDHTSIAPPMLRAASPIFAKISQRLSRRQPQDFRISRTTRATLLSVRLSSRPALRYTSRV